MVELDLDFLVERVAERGVAVSAAALAAASDVAVVMVGDISREGVDRTTLDLPVTDGVDQNALVAAVVAANPRTVVVLKNGGPVLLPWLDKVPAVLEAWYFLGAREASPIGPWLDDPRRGYCRTPAAGLAVAGIPSITLFGERYPEFRRADDGAALIDAAAVARVGHLAYGIGMAVGDGRPRLAVDSVLAHSLCR